MSLINYSFQNIALSNLKKYYPNITFFSKQHFDSISIWSFENICLYTNGKNIEASNKNETKISPVEIYKTFTDIELSIHNAQIDLGELFILENIQRLEKEMIKVGHKYGYDIYDYHPIITTPEVFKEEIKYTTTIKFKLGGFSYMKE